MEVGFVVLGVALIIAAFEIHFRYLELSKNHYQNVLNDTSEELDELLDKRKISLREKDERQLGKFLDELNKILGDFTIKRYEANFPDRLCLGFLFMGVFAIFLGFIYEEIFKLSETDFLPSIFVLFLIGGGISIYIIQALNILRKVTRIR